MAVVSTESCPSRTDNSTSFPGCCLRKFSAKVCRTSRVGHANSVRGGRERRVPERLADRGEVGAAMKGNGSRASGAGSAARPAPSRPWELQAHAVPRVPGGHRKNPVVAEGVLRPDRLEHQALHSRGSVEHLPHMVQRGARFARCVPEDHTAGAGAACVRRAQR